MTAKITFDEAMYDKLISAMNELETSLERKATTTDDMTLDADFTVLPGEPRFEAAVKLLNKGREFGGSVEQQNESLRQAIVKFRNALVAAKGVFKETNDLATYDAAGFIAQYPDFNVGGGAGVSPVPMPMK
ncbi:hypothetical protein [Saccharothrix yanglingensis]|uniref:Uncharacterized protein n=1 Tax=Saccharothrix yanglingensis TaxID=659496 RepID=A0ABU0XA98_9PSEU|nr:hypothetical protein [Saccharothrix yanglingensis]MDQ2589058.1 hypothetical protein [Saccharothrix yanglingensis]